MDFPSRRMSKENDTDTTACFKGWKQRFQMQTQELSEITPSVTVMLRFTQYGLGNQILALWT